MMIIFNNPKTRYFLLIAIMLLFMGCAAGSSTMTEGLDTPEARQNLFKEANQAMKLAEDKQTERFAPELMAKAVDLYNTAWEYLNKGKSLDTVQNKLDKAVMYFNQAINAADVTAALVNAAARAREDALRADAKKYAPEIWEDAEKLFEVATQATQDGDTEKSNKTCEKAEKVFRQAELDAIKKTILEPSWILLKDAEEADAGKYAPKTLTRARGFAVESEQVLDANRYDAKNAAQLAEKSSREAAHARRLAITVKELKGGDRTEEDLLLEAEAPLVSVAGEFEMQAGIGDKTGKQTADAILARAQRLKQEITNLEGVIKNKNKENANLKEKLLVKDNIIEDKDKDLASLQEETGTLRETAKTLQAEADTAPASCPPCAGGKRVSQVIMDKMADLKKMFTPEEGDVLLHDGGGALIRMSGLSFDTGESGINSRMFGLLAKLAEAVALFPDAHIMVEGHTDSVGESDKNLRLSKERAESVMAYLTTAGKVPDTLIESKGFGESQPVADNINKAGRAKNRRIDLIITPAEAKP